MKRLTLILLSLSFLTPAEELPPVDPDDVVLYAYEAEGITVGDDQLSEVWSSWDDRDKAVLTIDNHGWQRGTVPWSGPDDARMTIKAAHDAAGLYLYVEVEDNSFVEAQDGYQFDKADLYFDNQSSAGIYSKDPFEVFCYPTWWQCTYTSAQFQLAFGGSSEPTTFEYNHYDPAMWEMVYETVSRDEAAGTMDGLGFDIVELGGARKVQEWFVPWSHLGTEGVGEWPTNDMRFAFAGGYNDIDGDNPEAEAVNCLRWRNQVDPFASPDGPEAWGDIQIYRPGTGTRRPSATVRLNRTHGGHGRVFSVDGRLMPLKRVNNVRIPHGLVIVREARGRSCLKHGL